MVYVKMLGKKKVIVFVLFSFLLLESFPLLYAERTTSTLYFHEIEESYLEGAIGEGVPGKNYLQGTVGSIGVLNRSFPLKENISDAAKGTYTMEDVLEISGDIIFDLYFNVPLVNISPDIIDQLVNLTIKFANVTMGNLTLSNITKFIKIVFENLTKVNWSEFLGEISNISLGREEKFSIKVMDGSRLLKKEVVAIKSAAPENLSSIDLSLLLSPKKWRERFSERNIKHVTFTLKGVVYHARGNVGTATIIVEAENELAWVREILSKFGEINASFVIDILQGLGFENVSKREGLIKIAITFFNILRPLLESILNVSFVYDSCKYPSGITLAGKFVERKERGNRRYFLRNEVYEGKLSRALSEVPPIYGEESCVNLSSKSVRWTILQPFKYITRIYGNVTICLYIDYPAFKERVSEENIPITYRIKATLVELNGEMKKVATIGSNSTSVIALLAGNATYIELKGVNHVVERGHTIALDVKWDIPSFLEDVDIVTGMKPKLRYNCTDYPSYVELHLVDPDDIELKLESPAEQRILKSEKAVFKVNLSNRGKKGDVVNVTLWLLDMDFTVTPVGWNCTITGLSGITTYWEGNIKYIRGRAEVGAEGSTYIAITITPPWEAEYGKRLALHISAEGERGKDNITCYLQLSEELRVFNVIIVEPQGSKVRIGRSHTYTFEIKNAGNDVDVFLIEAISSNNWSTEVDPAEIELAPNESRKINVTIHVPGNVASGTEDYLTFTVLSEFNPSDKNATSIVTTAVAPSIIQLLTEFFDSAAKAVYLNRIFGASAGAALAIIVLVVIVIVASATIYITRRTFVELICIDRIKEIEPGKEGTYSITLRNPTKQRLTYRVFVDEEKLPEGWKINIPEKEVVLDPLESKEITLIVKPTGEVDPKGWAEIELQVLPVEKPKPSSITLLAIVKGAESKLRITGVFHWPKIFKAGDTITTRFTLRNDGNVAAKGLSVVLSVNGVEKNRVDDITIPAGGYADIKLPWIASRGKNRLRIVVKRM